MLDRDAASAVTGPIDATTVVRSRSAAGSAPSTRTKLRTADALVNVTDVDVTLEQHAVDVGVRLRGSGSTHDSAIRDGSVTSAPSCAARSQHLAADVGARQQTFNR